MSANVDTMFYTSREKPWHGLGTQVEEALTSKDALIAAGLNWKVIQKPVYTDFGIVPHYVANVRDSDNTTLGIVSDRYKIVQNSEAFDFTDSLITGNVKYETAGSLKKGRCVWLLAKLDSTNILGDKIEPYLCFSNSHDGTGAIRVCCTPIRVVCNNTLNLALNSANRIWTTRHMGDINSKLEEARQTLQLANKYTEALKEEADILANSKITNDEITVILNELFPINDLASDRQKANIAKAKEEIMVCCLAPDLIKFINTKYGFINAVADWCGHAEPVRNTDEYRANNWGRIMTGHPILDRAYELVNIH